MAMNTARPAQGLGWIGQEDPRKEQYQLRAARPQGPAPLRSVVWKMAGHPLDQGQTGCCVGFGTKHWELCKPVTRTKRDGKPGGVDFYLAATARDDFHHGQPDTSLQDGTSITASMLALRDQFKLIAAFHWTQDADDLLGFLTAKDGGPVILGLPWMNSMFTTSEEGILTVDFGSGQAGGHCVTAARYDAARDLVGGPNSWGRPIDFGQLDPKTGHRDGWWWLATDDLRKLLAAGGDACAAHELPA